MNEESQVQQHEAWLDLEIKALFEELEQPCPHVHRVLPNRPKRACDECYESIKGKVV